MSKHKWSRKYSKLTLVREVVVIALVLIMLSPFYILVVNALKDNSDALTSSPLALPKSVDFDNFTQVLFPSNGRGQSALIGMLNSVLITGGTLLILVALGSAAAYVVARRSGRMGRATYVVFLLGIILPFQLGLIPAYVGLRALGLVGTQLGVIVLYSGIFMPLSVFLYAGFARALPRDYEEAALLDGASRFQAFRLVVFPMLAPATGTVLILVGLATWNDFFTPLIFLSGSSAQTLPVLVYSFVGSNSAQWNLIFAMVIVSMVPILVLYLVAQRRFIQGFAGGIKG
jgi:raffinose/stachyose/melibiose transport system permease protein